jgi:hypothetical protein
LAVFHLDGEPHIVGQYKATRRHGVLQVFDENGERVLWVEAKNGNLDGLTCLFEDGKPRLIREYKASSLLGEFVVEFQEGQPKVTSTVVFKADDLHSRLNAIEAEVSTIEAAIKQEISTWCREQAKAEFEKSRPERAQASRARQAQWAAEQAAAEAAAQDALWRAIQRANTPFRLR